MASSTRARSVRHPSSGRWVGWSAQRGSTSIQMVMLMPALFTVLFLGLQAALYYYAATVAGAAAQDGARVAAAYGSGGTDAGAAAARSALDQSHGSLQNYTVAASASVAGPEITVTGDTLSVLPGMTFSVTRSASLPWERPS